MNPATGFYYPKAEETLTIPSTAAKVITVGAYDSRLNAPADFSGRGGGSLFIQSRIWLRREWKLQRRFPAEDMEP